MEAIQYNVQVQEKDEETIVDEIGRTQPMQHCQRINMVKFTNTLRKQANGVQLKFQTKTQVQHRP